MLGGDFSMTSGAWSCAGAWLATSIQQSRMAA
jgi:hypothetical protein